MTLIDDPLGGTLFGKSNKLADEYPPDAHMKSMGLTKASPLCAFANQLIWGTYGKPVKLPVQYKFLYELDSEHLENILITQRHIPVIYSRAILLLLEQRSEGRGWRRRGEGTVVSRIWSWLNAL